MQAVLLAVAEDQSLGVGYLLAAPAEELASVVGRVLVGPIVVGLVAVLHLVAVGRLPSVAAVVGLSVGPVVVGEGRRSSSRAIA